MISVEEAKKKIIENVKTLETIEIPLTEAEGFVLSKDIISSVNLPYFTNSQMDGYALKSEDTKGASETNPVKLKVIGEIKAGDFPNYIVKSGDAAKIMTGAPIPEGADSVIMVEYTDEKNGFVNIVKEVFPKEFISTTLTKQLRLIHDLQRSGGKSLSLIKSRQNPTFSRD